MLLAIPAWAASGSSGKSVPPPAQSEGSFLGNLTVGKGTIGVTCHSADGAADSLGTIEVPMLEEVDMPNGTAEVQFNYHAQLEQLTQQIQESIDPNAATEVGCGFLPVDPNSPLAPVVNGQYVELPGPANRSK